MDKWLCVLLTEQHNVEETTLNKTGHLWYVGCRDPSLMRGLHPDKLPITATLPQCSGVCIEYSTSCELHMSLHVHGHERNILCTRSCTQCSAWKLGVLVTSYKGPHQLAPLSIPTRISPTCSGFSFCIARCTQLIYLESNRKLCAVANATYHQAAWCGGKWSLATPLQCAVHTVFHVACWPLCRLPRIMQVSSKRTL